MTRNNFEQMTPRRGFLGVITKSAAAVGLTALMSPAQLTHKLQETAKLTLGATSMSDEAELWFDKIKGKHRVVFDATRPHEIMPFIWPKVFMLTNESTGTPPNDQGVVVVLRHEAIAYAFKDEMWAKYHFDEIFNAGDVGQAFLAMDAKTATKTRNPFWMTKHGDFGAPGFGMVDIGIKDLQAGGVMFCVCNAAITVYTNVVANMSGTKADDVMNDWKAHLIPGIQVVPSGVWALGRAQEHKCAYIFAG